MECAPSIQQQPASQAAVPGGSAAFNVRVYTAYGITNYQWYFNNSPLARATNSTLLLNNLQSSNFGAYYVWVYGGGDAFIGASTSMVANLTIAGSPSLTNFSVGSNAKFSFRTEVGPNYVVEYKSALADSAWIPQSTNSGTGGIIQVTDPAVGVASRFYRVRLF
jgi:hypothetical protein